MSRFIIAETWNMSLIRENQMLYNELVESKLINAGSNEGAWKKIGWMNEWALSVFSTIFKYNI